MTAWIITGVGTANIKNYDQTQNARKKELLNTLQTKNCKTQNKSPYVKLLLAGKSSIRRGKLPFDIRICVRRDVNI